MIVSALARARQGVVGAGPGARHRGLATLGLLRAQNNLGFDLDPQCVEMRVGNGVGTSRRISERRFNDWKV